MTTEELKKIFDNPSMKEAVLIGDVDNRERYYPAIVEVDCTKGKVTYDYDLLAECFAKEFYESDRSEYDSFDDAMTAGYEWVDYNVVRSLPYWGEHAPIILERDPEEEDSNQ